jgi:hypothetical protein
MKETNVFMCNEGHLVYCDDEPKKCKFCDSTKFGRLGVTVELEDDDDVSSESGHDSY